VADSIVQVSIVPTDTALADLIGALSAVSTRYLPNTTRAIKLSTAILEYTWKAYAMGAPIPGTTIRLKNVRGMYAKSIKKTSAGLQGIVYSDSPYAIALEEGTPAKDLKTIIPFGPKSRVGKRGPYTIVPFRHGVPTALSAPMPNAVYEQIRAKIQAGEIQKSQVRRETVVSPNVRGEPVVRHTYRWGSRLKIPQFPLLEGMVVFNVSAGAQPRSAFVTFRVVSANKPVQSKALRGWENSWVVPARQGLHITKYVVANTQQIIAEAIKAGITQDLLA